jgi:5-methylthioribose kinase
LLELTAGNAPEYLAGRGVPTPRSVIELGGGVSNTVLLVETGEGRFVLKQSLGKLRVEQDWFSDRGRIFRESEALRALAPCLPAGAVPEVLWEDRQNCLFAMSAAKADARTWKAQLMHGEVDEATAARVGEMLAAIIRRTWHDPDAEQVFGDQTVFDQLRLDPYYRSTASLHPDLSPQFQKLISESSTRRHCLVHGDWSPKNFLVSGRGVMAIDFEVIHYGDPAFDAAFLLNHLALKSFKLPAYRDAMERAAMAFWGALRAGMPAGTEWMERATVEHLGALMLARVDGKSPAEYLDSEGLRALVRGAACGVMTAGADTVAEVFAMMGRVRDEGIPRGPGSPPHYD